MVKTDSQACPSDVEVMSIFLGDCAARSEYPFTGLEVATWLKLRKKYFSADLPTALTLAEVQTVLKADESDLRIDYKTLASRLGELILRGWIRVTPQLTPATSSPGLTPIIPRYLQQAKGWKDYDHMWGH